MPHLAHVKQRIFPFKETLLQNCHPAPVWCFTCHDGIHNFARGPGHGKKVLKHLEFNSTYSTAKKFVDIFPGYQNARKHHGIFLKMLWI